MRRVRSKTMRRVRSEATSIAVSILTTRFHFPLSLTSSNVDSGIGLERALEVSAICEGQRELKRRGKGF